ncbi:MAG: DUF928 domain-containing protein [Leptolyngbyaceae cyanobacterium SL_5_9]|nr:DUF928 domain-containing protein [Leptolyngbyaceae cyanobacterium SL_5_9]NJO75286.1 DUF928 domain-containing protein [Leptolyngbyaceae cyanobacterium RM1_406_9]
MNWKSCFVSLFSLPLLVGAIALWLSSPGWAQTTSNPAANPSVAQQSRSRTSRITFRPPNRGAPPVTSGAASRGDWSDCTASTDALTALIPSSRLGLSVSQEPVLMVYIPETSATSLELTLENEDGTEVLYNQTLDVPGTAGIVQFNLADYTSTPLAEGNLYRWYVSLVCDDEDRSRNAVIAGWVEPVEPSAALIDHLQQADPQDRPRLYAEAGIWYDALHSLADLYQSQPQNAMLTADWQALLQSVGLDAAIAQAPLINCCTSTN